MSSTTPANTSVTPITGTKRRFLGAARRNKKTTYSVPFLPGDEGPKQPFTNATEDIITKSIDSVQSDERNKRPETKDSCLLQVPADTCNSTVQFPEGVRKRSCQDDSSDLQAFKLETLEKPAVLITPNRRGAQHYRRGLLLQTDHENTSQKDDGRGASASSSSVFSSSQSHCESTPVHRRRLPLINSLDGSARKRLRHDFKSPMRSNQDSPKPSSTTDSVSTNIDTMEQTLKQLQSEIASLRNEGCCEDELQTHIAKMHEYNELKDTGQMLLGKIALIDGVTTKDLYGRFDLDLND